MRKLERGKLLARDRGRKPPRVRRSRTASKRSKQITRYTPSSRAIMYAQRAARDATIVGMYKHFGRACRAKVKYHTKLAERAKTEQERDLQLKKAKSWVLDMSLDEWCLTWLSCCDILIVEGQGIYATQKLVPAWKARGRDYRTSPQLKRVDTLKPWTRDNVRVLYKGEIISRT